MQGDYGDQAMAYDDEYDMRGRYTPAVHDLDSYGYGYVRDRRRVESDINTWASACLYFRAV